jgi:hypothetical protein
MLLEQPEASPPTPDQGGDGDDLVDPGDDVAHPDLDGAEGGGPMSRRSSCRRRCGLRQQVDVASNCRNESGWRGSRSGKFENTSDRYDLKPVLRPCQNGELVDRVREVGR